MVEFQWIALAVTMIVWFQYFLSRRHELKRKLMIETEQRINRLHVSQLFDAGVFVNPQGEVKTVSGEEIAAFLLVGYSRDLMCEMAHKGEEKSTDKKPTGFESNDLRSAVKAAKQYSKTLESFQSVPQPCDLYAGLRQRIGDSSRWSAEWKEVVGYVERKTIPQLSADGWYIYAHVISMLQDVKTVGKLLQHKKYSALFDRHSPELVDVRAATTAMVAWRRTMVPADMKPQLNNALKWILGEQGIKDMEAAQEFFENEKSRTQRFAECGVYYWM